MKIMAATKRGDSFSLTCTYKELGEAKSLSGIAIRSQLRNATGELVCDLVATIAPDQVATPGRFFLAPADQTVTKSWPASAVLSCDIEFTNGGTVFSTETFQIPIEKDITI